MNFISLQHCEWLYHFTSVKLFQMNLRKGFLCMLKIRCGILLAPFLVSSLAISQTTSTNFSKFADFAVSLSAILTNLLLHVLSKLKGFWATSSTLSNVCGFTKRYTCCGGKISFSVLHWVKITIAITTEFNKSYCIKFSKICNANYSFVFEIEVKTSAGIEQTEMFNAFYISRNLELLTFCHLVELFIIHSVPFLYKSFSRGIHLFSLYVL